MVKCDPKTAVENIKNLKGFERIRVVEIDKGKEKCGWFKRLRQSWGI
jgi:hypothetical protein